MPKNMKEETRKKWNAYTSKYRKANYKRYTVLLRLDEDGDCIDYLDKNDGSKTIRKILLENYKK